MKRILAVFLTLAMALNIAPMAAFAAADSDAASIVAVEETDENASPQLDEETARAIASDPFLQAAYAQTEQEQTGRAEVDTSDVSMEATDSFGRLLLAGMDEQQTNGTGDGTKKITSVTVSGNTATVEYVSDQIENLVVAIYTDDTEQEMVASGRMATNICQDGKARTDEVKLTGDIPSSFVVKAYLLDYYDYDPLCNAFVSNEYTQDMKDLANASVADYPEERVVNLDDQMDTNFAVVNEDVVLINQDDAAVGAMSIAENGDGSYTITNADTKTKALDVGDVFVYQDDDNGILILQIETIDIEGNTVTITGNDSLELIDVFDVVKIESSDDGSELEYDGTGVDSDVHYLGVGVADDYDETNEISSGEISGAFAHKFVIGTDTFMDNEKDDEDYKDKLPEDTHITSKFGINAVLNLKITAKIKYYVSLKKQSIDYSVENEMSGGIEVYQKQSIKIDVGHFKKELPGVYLNYTPQFVYEGDVKGEFYYKVTGKQGFKCEDKNIVDTSEKPTSEISIKISGTVYIGVEYAPTLKIGFYKLFAPKTEENLFELLEAKITLQVGAEAEISTTLRTGDAATKKIVANANLPDSCHECAVCLAGDIYAKVNLTVSIDVIKVWQDSWTLVDIRPSIGKVYYSEDHHKFGFGDCPYNLYLVDISIDKTDLPENTEVFVTDGVGNKQSIGTLQGSTGNYCYMSPGAYTLKTTVQDGDYSCKIEVKNTKVEALLKHGKGDGGSTGNTGNTGNIVGSGKCGDNLTWKLDANGTLTISGTGNMYDYVLGGKDSTRWAPWKKESVKNIIIENGVSSIGDVAFNECKNLETVEIPDTINTIGKFAFSLTGLTDITIPNSVWQIKGYAFSGCTGLTSVIIPDSVMSIGGFAFDGCKNLENVSLPDGITKLEDGIFDRCSKLSKIELPQSIREIGNSAFADTAIKEIELPKQLSVLGPLAFGRCKNLVSIEIPDGIKEINGEMFLGCCALENVKLPDGITKINLDAFSGCSSLTKIDIPESVTYVGNHAFSGCTGLTEITIPPNVQNLGQYVFSGCTNLEKVNLPEGIEYIGAGAFTRCIALETVKMPTALNQIEFTMFDRCTGLKSVEIPEGVQEIEFEAFVGCKNLTEVIIPESVSKIEQKVFRGCKSLKEIIYRGTKEQWNTIEIDNAYSYNIEIMEMTIHCTDGDIVPNTENSITTGTATEKSGTYYAAFENAKAGKEYVVIVSKSKGLPLSADNLIYINQITADADDELTVPFRTAADAAEMTYVVACAQDDATDPTPADPDTPSSGGDGGGAIILIGGVAAVAAIAGVVMLMPVKVEGTVKLADQPVANATVQVLKDGSVAAQTTTDANGHFTVKVKRGGYTLRVQWTDAEGQPVVRTVDFKAPNANLNVAA